MNLVQGTAQGWRFINARKLAPILFLAALAGDEAAPTAWPLQGQPAMKHRQQG